MRTLALVESPAQLLSVVEWAHHPATDPGELRVIVLAPEQEVSRWQLRTTAALARAAGLDVGWHEPRTGGAVTARTLRSLADELGGVRRLVLGDPFSGVMQVVVSVTQPHHVVIVDDGTATLEFARQWAQGEHLSRWHQTTRLGARRQVTTFARNRLADMFSRRLALGVGGGLTMFSCLPVELPQARVVRHTFGWLRAHREPPVVKLGGDLVGTSLVETGVMDAGAYEHAVEVLAARHGVDRYLAHRKEDEAKLRRIAAAGLSVVRAALPLEVTLRQGPVGRTVISFPSTVVHTLPLVLRDIRVDLRVCAIDPDWLTPDAPVRSADFLADVTDGARSRFGLAAVAC